MKYPVFTFLTIILLAGVPGGCASGPATENPALAESPPPDFTLAMTVMAATSRRNSAAVPRERRPARFVIETDWVLRSFTGPGVDDDSFPSETRQLAQRDIEALWNDLRNAGLLDPAHPNIVGTAPELDDLESGGPVWVVSFTADADRRTLVLEPGAEAPGSVLLSRLCDLAWMPE